MLPMPEHVCLSCERNTWPPPSPPLLEATSQQLLEVLRVQVTHSSEALLLAVCPLSCAAASNAASLGLLDVLQRVLLAPSPAWAAADAQRHDAGVVAHHVEVAVGRQVHAAVPADGGRKACRGQHRRQVRCDSI